MSAIVIQVEDLSKQYRLGEVSTGSLGHDLNRWWHRVRSKEDPYLKVTQTNIRNQATHSKNSRFDYVWALRDINFEVKQGEVLGIIGRNGAGKSTLLKILSRITAPTTGEVRVKGRIASLLEVGTGFHPDLTGRENVFLNGAILGMTKTEIQSKLDEIVDFSGCERYVDTPVKRYSSGMVVRLGFAVAAHLEPEILIVDEVLAVGDAEFQKKCIGKMKDVAGHGRTVLFVSHNMASIAQLTRKCVMLNEGRVERIDSTDETIRHYVGRRNERVSVETQVPVDDRSCERQVAIDPRIRFVELGMHTADGGELAIGGDLVISAKLVAARPLQDIRLSYSLVDELSGAVLSGISPPFSVAEKGFVVRNLTLHRLMLAPGRYSLNISVGQGGLHEPRCDFEIVLGFGSFCVGPFTVNKQPVTKWQRAWGGWIHDASSIS